MVYDGKITAFIKKHTLKRPYLGPKRLKTTHFGAAHSCIDHIREYPWLLVLDIACNL